jgi:hypothetical protein
MEAKLGSFDNEVAAANHQRRVDEESCSPVNRIVGELVVGASPAIAVASAVSSANFGSAGLAIAGGIIGGFGIIDWFRRLGSSKVSDNLETLGEATEEALNRVERILREQGVTIDEIKARLESEGFREGMASASLQALRTTQESRLRRMAEILATGIERDELRPDITDGLMRAAAELQDRDVELLQRIYEAQASLLFSRQRLSSDWGEQVALGWANRFGFLDSENWIGARSSLARLQSMGFIQDVRTNMVSTGELRTQPFGLLPEGKRFIERIHGPVSNKN